MPLSPFYEKCATVRHCATKSGSAELLALSRAVLQLGPDRRDPEKFFLDKSEIAYRLKKLAREMDAA
jgi:hypothetical protein